MYSFWNFFLTKRAFTYLLIVALSLFGFLSLSNIPKESTPEVRVPVGIVTTIFPGASPEDVEQLVTDEIEDGLQGNLTDLSKLTSTSAEGVSSVVAEFSADADLDASIQELRDEVEKIRTSLPNEADDPIVSEVNFVDQPILTLAIAGDLDARAFSTLADELETELETISGVSRIGISGLREHEVHIIVRKEALARYGITLSQIIGALNASNASLPIGDIIVDEVTYAVTFDGEINTVNELFTLAIANTGGAPILLSDVADIKDTFAEETSISRVSIGGVPSAPALTLDIFKRQGGDITAITKAIHARIEELKAPGELLDGLDTLTVFDTGEQLEHDLKELGRVGVEAVILVMITLFLTLGWREALLAGSSIPLSLLAAFIGLEYSGNTLNFVSLFALILSVGILVDTGIVVVESIHTKVAAGSGRFEAARYTLREFAWPLIAGTFTTIGVFAPLFLISGITGQFIANIPFTIITVLLASIFVSLGLLPAIATVALKARGENRMEKLQEDYTHKFQAWYATNLKKILGHRKRENWFVASMIAGLFVALSLPALGIVKVEFFPQEDVDFLIVEIERPQGSVISNTDLYARQVEEILYEDPNIASFTTTVGSGSAFTGGGANTKSANIFINLSEERDLTSSEIVEELRPKLEVITGAEVRINQPNNGPPTGDPVVITFTGENIDALETTVSQAENLLAEIPGTVDVETSTENATTQFVFTIDRVRAGQLGISPLVIAQTLRTAIHGTEATTIKTPDEDLEVIVRIGLAPEASVSPREIALSSIEQIEIQTSQGSVLLGSLVETDLSRSLTTIEHKDGKRIATVSSQLGEGGNALEIISQFQARAETELTMPAGVTLSVGGENEDAEEAFKDMFLALILGLILMLAILVIQFNSFRHALYLLSIVPLSIIGVFLGLMLGNRPISFPSLMGFIALAGVIVNHVIILTDLIITIWRERPNDSMENIVVEASTRRLRPILLTTITTILGLVPLLFVSELWAPLAYAIMFGLAFAVTITLVLIPIIYRRWPGKLPH